MVFDSFGYNGVLQLAEPLVNRLLATQAYELNLVDLGGGKISNAELLAPIAIPLNGGVVMRLYLLLGRPKVTFDGHDGSNRIVLFAPMFGVGLFRDDGKSVKRSSLNFGQSFGVKLSDVRVVANGSVQIDFSKVTADSVIINTFTFVEPPTHVGGQVMGGYDPTDGELDTALKAANVPITGKQLRAEIAKQVKAGAIQNTQVKLDPGGLLSALSKWDLFTFDAAIDMDGDSDDAGAELLLYEPSGKGKGVLPGGDTIPTADTEPPYGWTASIRADVLLEDFKIVLDRGMFLHQGQEDMPNTHDHPFGYMVVPGMGSAKYSLPLRADSVTVDAPNNGVVTVTIGAGALAPFTKGRLQVVGPAREAPFAADDKGNAKTQIQAIKGDRLALVIDAISLPGNASIIIWRPAIQFIDGGLRFDFHAQKNANGCWIDTDGHIAVKLVADQSKAFQIGARVTGSEFDAPWWSYVLAWIGGEFVLGFVGFVVAEIILASFVRDWIRDQADPDKRVKFLLGEINARLHAPAPPNGALFLDDVMASPAGMILSGRADAGRIVSYGRTVAFSTAPGYVIETPSLVPIAQHFHLALFWQPELFGAINIKPGATGKAILIDADAVRTFFWKSSLDELPAPPYPGDSLALQAGGVAMLVVDDGESIVKLLFQRPPHGQAPSSAVFITWIAYQKRVVESVRLKNQIVSRVTIASESLTLSFTCYAYRGPISLETVKFFLNDDTTAAGDEHWLFDGVEITKQGIALPGGSVSLGPGKHQIFFDLDQSQLPDVDAIPAFHTVRFEGTDVFGRKQSAQILVQTPPCVLRPKGLALRNPWDVIHDPRVPLGDPLRMRNPALGVAARELMVSELGHSFKPLIDTVADALSNGSAPLDAESASVVLDLIVGRGRR